MKAEELMIGDIVRVNKDVSVKKGTIVKVREIDGDRRFQELTGCISCVAVDDIDEMTAGVWLAYIEPIPLTEEILMLNFPKPYDIRWYPEDDSKDVFCIAWEEPIGLGYSMNLAIRYVHELQHALRLCGIEKEIVLNPEP